jgi:hypothetical protein
MPADAISAVIQLFRTHHSSDAPSEQLAFNLKVLEFITLFTHRLHPTSVPIDPAAICEFQEVQGHVLRRRSLLYRHHRRPIDPLDLEHQFDHTLQELWHNFTSHITEHPVAAVDLPQLPLTLLIPLFLELSAETVNVLDQEPGEVWMELAAQFMLRSALETLTPVGMHLMNQVLHRAAGSKSQPMWEGGISEGGGSHIYNAFSWGYIDQARLKQEFKDQHDQDEAGQEFELLVNAMFQDRLTGKELEAWGGIRRTYLAHFDCGIETACDARLRELDARFPAAELDTKVMDFMEGIWTLVGSGSEHNKPVLVQIEEGHLNGLNDEEFKGFMKRIGGEEHLQALSQIVLDPRTAHPNQPNQQPQARAHPNQQPQAKERAQM